jgi:hypothetical protein
MADESSDRKATSMAPDAEGSLIKSVIPLMFKQLSQAHSTRQVAPNIGNLGQVNEFTVVKAHG